MEEGSSCWALKEREAFIYLFIYFWLHWVFVAVCGLSLVVASGATLGCCVRASHCGGLILAAEHGL